MIGDDFEDREDAAAIAQEHAEALWPVWDVELRRRFGGMAGESILIAAPDAATARASANEQLMGSGFTASDSIQPARLPLCHPRFAVTDAAYARYLEQGNLIDPPVWRPS